MVSDFSTKTYLDYAATTPVDQRVLEKMLPFFSSDFGNPSSVHLFGQRAEAAVEQARDSMAADLGCHPDEIIFTSCGSESDNLALRGAAFAQRETHTANHILISPVEHHAVSITAKQLQINHGFVTEELPVDEYGRVSTDTIEKHLRNDTGIVSVIYANNEIGTINPIEDLAIACNQRGVIFHTDAVQAAAHLPIDLSNSAIDLLSIGAHKFYGPKGIGALYIRKGTELLSQQTGGDQEFSFRAGTSNVPLIIGMAEAFHLVQLENQEREKNLSQLRNKLIGNILSSIPDSQLTGHPSERLPNHASFVFKDVDGNNLLMMLDMEGFACSSGSACKTGNPEPSEVLSAIGLPREWSLGSLRITLGKYTTEEEIERFLQVLPDIVSRNRALEAV